MKVVCYAEPTENGLLLHYPSKEIKQSFFTCGKGQKKTITDIWRWISKSRINQEAPSKIDFFGEWYNR